MDVLKYGLVTGVVLGIISVLVFGTGFALLGLTSAIIWGEYITFYQIDEAFRATMALGVYSAIVGFFMGIMAKNKEPI